MKISLDLLPKERKQELKRKKIFRRILHQEILFLFPIIVLAVVLSNVYYLLSFQKSSSSEIQSQDKYQKLKQYEEKFKQVNEATGELLKIQAGHLRWSRVFEKMDSATPEGIVINNFSTKDYAVFLVGKAKSRDTLLSFKDRLESGDCFEGVNVPLSNLVVKNDVDFQIDFSIKNECLKNWK